MQTKELLKEQILFIGGTDSAAAFAAFSGALKNSGIIAEITNGNTQTLTSSAASQYNLVALYGTELTPENISEAAKWMRRAPLLALADTVSPDIEKALLAHGSASIAGHTTTAFSCKQALAQAAKARRENSIEIARKMDAIGRLAGAVAHDFNNILGAIEGYATLLIAEIPANNPLRADIEEILKAEHRAAALTKQLSIFSRKHATLKNIAEVKNFINSVKNSATQLISNKIVLEVNCAENLKPIELDAHLLEQALVNLLFNACEAMPDGGRVVLEASSAHLPADHPSYQAELTNNKQYIKIVIRDTGKGLTEETMAHIFEPYFTTKKKTKGAGLGLATAYSIIRQHNGWLQAQTTPEYGSAFVIYMPTVQQQTSAQTLSSSLTQETGCKCKVLLIENDEALRALTARALKKNNYQVIETISAEDAMNKFLNESDSVNYIVASLSSEEDAWILAGKFQAVNQKVRFIFTGNHPPSGLKSSFVFIQKPYSVETVLEALRAAGKTT